MADTRQRKRKSGGGGGVWHQRRSHGCHGWRHGGRQMTAKKAGVAALAAGVAAYLRYGGVILYRSSVCNYLQKQ
jgi:hypothetical protein